MTEVTVMPEIDLATVNAQVAAGLKRVQEVKEKTAELKEKSATVTISGDDDKAGHGLTKSFLGEVRTIRTSLEKERQVCVKPFNDLVSAINDIFSSIDTKQRVYYLLKERGLMKAEFTAFMEMVDNEGLVKVLKGLGIYKTTGRGAEKTVMCDPYIWVLIALELNPMIYAKVVLYLTDSLIFDRVDAGTEYKPMNISIKSVVGNPDYSKYAIEINNRVFGKHQTGMRNLASAKELRKIADIEKFITNVINQKWLKSEIDILNAIKNYN